MPLCFLRRKDKSSIINLLTLYTSNFFEPSSGLSCTIVNRKQLQWIQLGYYEFTLVRGVRAAFAEVFNSHCIGFNIDEAEVMLNVCSNVTCIDSLRPVILTRLCSVQMLAVVAYDFSYWLGTLEIFYNSSNCYLDVNKNSWSKTQRPTQE